VDHERFAEHLAAPEGRGDPPPGAHDGAAGGAVCGDLIRISSRAGDRVDAVSFDASGCGAVTAGGSAVVTLVEDACCWMPRGSGRARSRTSSAGSRRASCTRPSWRPTRCTRARPGGRDAALAFDARRTLVAMSGGVDSAVAALLVGRAGARRSP
jgi:tRNA-specific 2-thiouridylase